MTYQTRIWQIIAIAALIALGAIMWMRVPQTTPPAEVPTAVDLPPIGYSVIDYTALPGWADAEPAGALGPFLRSCNAILARPDDQAANPAEYVGEDLPVSLGGRVADWREPCAAARDLVAAGPVEEDAARRFFEMHFRPVAISQPLVNAEAPPTMTDSGVFTGYFEPIFPASSQPSEEFSAPVLTRPEDLVTVDLGRFRPELAGTRVAGRVEDGVLVPYATHAEIAEDGVDTEVLAWMNPNDLLFMQIQGSGRLSIDGDDVRVGYAAPNGHAYTAIGRELVRMEEIALEDISMQSIYEWLEAAPPAEAARVRHVNESYIFFRPLADLAEPSLGPLGAQGVQLTPMRSLAVDLRYHAMGAPVWVDLGTDDNHPEPLRRLMIAQDTGGAIRGPVRGDVFTGIGAEAGGAAGRMNRTGRLYTLLPRAIAERITGDDPQATAADA